MASELCCSASSLLTGLLDGSQQQPVGLTEVARSRTSVHYETGDDGVPVLSVCTPDAVRLPHAVVATRLPSSPLVLDNRRLRGGDATWRVVRWWRPARPRGLAAPDPAPWPAHPGGFHPERLVGAGPGLTPAGDDVVAGALVAAHATADARLAGWQHAVHRQLDRGRTTAVSRAILLCALAGYATEPLAEFVRAVCTAPADERRSQRARSALLAVGHTSGAAMLSGVQHVLGTAAAREAA